MCEDQLEGMYTSSYSLMDINLCPHSTDSEPRLASLVGHYSFIP